jgi:RNA polymerase sigma-70 factor (ECF subfamily)
MSEQLATDAEASELTLVERLRAGDRGAARELYRRYAGYVERLVERTFGAHRELPELVTEVFASIVEQARTLEDPASFKAWLGKVALFSARTRLRSRSQPDGGRQWPPSAGASRVTPKPRLVEAERGQLRSAPNAARALDCLTVEEQTVYSLRFVEAMELTRIAATMGTSVTIVKRRLASARQALERAAQHEPSLREYARAFSVMKT